VALQGTGIDGLKLALLYERRHERPGATPLMVRVYGHTALVTTTETFLATTTTTSAKPATRMPATHA